MKTTLRLQFIVSFLMGSVFSAYSQVPQGFNYQAVAHNTSGAVIPLATMQVKASILSDTLTPVIIWEELHSTVRTNAAGVFSIVIGTGTKQAGSAASFSAIDWSKGTKFLKIQIYYQNAWKYMGTSKLWTVPYAMSSGSLTGGVSKFSVKGQETSPDSALFVVKNKNGQIVFAVFNEGVRIYVDDGAKGSKGGFAVGSFGTEKGTSQNLLTVSSDSVRIYVDETAAKGSKGGFAVGGFSEAKGTTNEFLFLTPDNYFIGHNSGRLVETGIYNSTLGYESGKSLTNGSNNVLIGYKSGFSNSTGGSNVLIGTQAGYLNSGGYYNVILGRQAGYNTTSSSNIYLGDLTAYSNTTGYQNVMIGDWAGYNNIDGDQNVFLGAEAGWNNTEGDYNNLIGFQAGYENSTGSYNSFFGYQAGYQNLTGEKNTFLGYQAGYSGINASGSNNIFMGVEAGYSNLSGFDNVAIGNQAGRANTDGTYNIMIGSKAGSQNVSGDFNTLVGYQAGEKTTSNYSTMVGYLAGSSSVTGDSQTMFGYEAGSTNTGSYNTMLGVLAGGNSGTGQFNTYVGIGAGNFATGSNNVFLGKWAGYNEAGSNKLIIENNYLSTDNLNNALIYGDFTSGSRYVKVNGLLSSSALRSNGYAADFRNSGGTTSYYGLKLTAGTNDGTGLNYHIDFFSNNNVWQGSIVVNNQDVALFQTSDSRLKEEIESTGINALKMLDDIKVVDYNYTKSPAARHTGYVAQEVMKVFPEMVIYNERQDVYAIATAKLIPVLHKAINEQQDLILKQRNEIASLRAELKMIKDLLERNNLK